MSDASTVTPVAACLAAASVREMTGMYLRVRAAREEAHLAILAHACGDLLRRAPMGEGACGVTTQAL
ncbi:MAG TPA: hypothetical protein VF792_01735 [Ktedonobacterales bacterium]